MKHFVILLIIILPTVVNAQFTGTDSLRNYNNRYITTNPATAFTNNRLNTLLRGIIDFIDTARAGSSGGVNLGIDTVFAVNDSTIRYRKNGVFRQFTLKGVYDSRRKVDTIYKSNDTTLTFTVNGNIRTVIIPGGTNINLATANQTATGDRTHNWDNHWLYLNNVKSFGIYQDQPDANHPDNTFKTQIITDSSIDGTPLQLMWGLRNIDDDIIDSVHFELTSKDSATYLYHYGADTSKSAKLSLNGNAPTVDIRMDVVDDSKTSSFKFGATTSINPNDSVLVKALAAATADSLLATRAFNNGVNTVIKIPASNIRQRFGLEDATASTGRTFNANGNNFNIDSVGNWNVFSKSKTSGADRGALTNFGFNTNNSINLWSYIPGSSTRSYGFNAYGALTQMFAAGHSPGHATYVQSDTLQVILEADPNRLYMFHDSVALHNITGGAIDFRIRTLPQTIDTTNFKPLAIGPLGQVKRFTGWAGGGGPGSTFTAGTSTPDNLFGANGDYYFLQNKSWLYKKNAGVWGSPLGYLRSDTTWPIHTELYRHNYISLANVWDTASLDWMDGIQRNSNVIGNETLPFKDDPVRVWGWNIDVSGNRIKPYRAAMLWHHESNFKTDPFVNSPYFESHISVLFKPGSTGYNWGGGGERVESWNISQETYDIYKYNIKTREWWQSRLDSMADHTIYFDITPNYFLGRGEMKIKDVNLGTWMELDGLEIGSKQPAYGRNRYIYNRSGFLDTAILMNSTGGDFVFQTWLGSGRTMFNLPVGLGLNADDANGRAPIQLNQTGEIFTHKYDDATNNFQLSAHNSHYGITLNRPSTRAAYLDIGNHDQRLDMEMYFTNDNNSLPDVGNGVNFNIHKLRQGSFTNSSLQGTDGYNIKLNTVSQFSSKLTTNQAANSEWTADFIWSTRKTDDLRERMRLTDTGYLVLKYIDSTSSPVNMLYQDTDGTIKKASVPSGGINAINSHAGPAITVQGGTALSVDNSVSNVVTFNVTPSSNSIPHTLDVQYTTAGNTGTSETDLFSYTLPANKLSIDGRTVNFEIDGEFNDNTVTAQLRLYFAGNVTLNTGAVSVSTAFTKWKLTGYIMRTSSSTAHVTYELQCPGLATTIFLGYSNLTSLDFTTTNVFKVSAQAAGGGASNSDITAHSWQLLYKPQPQ